MPVIFTTKRLASQITSLMTNKRERPKTRTKRRGSRRIRLRMIWKMAKLVVNHNRRNKTSTRKVEPIKGRNHTKFLNMVKIFHSMPIWTLRCSNINNLNSSSLWCLNNISNLNSKPSTQCPSHLSSSKDPHNNNHKSTCRQTLTNRSNKSSHLSRWAKSLWIIRKRWKCSVNKMKAANNEKAKNVISLCIHIYSFYIF